MDLVAEIKAKAKSRQKKLVLPEGTDLRTLKAARLIVESTLAASVTVLGREPEVRKLAAAEGVNLGGVNILDQADSGDIERYAKEFYELRKHKGMTMEQARADILAPLRWGAMMLHLGDVDAMVAGAENTTADVLRAGLAIIAAGAVKLRQPFMLFHHGLHITQLVFRQMTRV